MRIDTPGSTPHPRPATPIKKPTRRDGETEAHGKNQILEKVKTKRKKKA